MSKNNIRVGVVGTGFIGTVHIENLRRLPNVEVVSITTTQDTTKVRDQFNVESVFNDYKEMIDQSALDVIHICSPNYTHAEITLYALDHGVNVFCEKPMALSIEEAQQMTDKLKEKNLKGGLNFHNRFFATVKEMKEREIGDIISVHGQYIQDWLLLQEDYSWRLISKESGDTRAVADIGSHWFDLAQFTSGHKIVEVMADFKTQYPTRMKQIGTIETFKKSDDDAQFEEIEIDTEDVAAILVRFDNGAIGTVMVSQMAAGEKNNYSLTLSGTKNSLTWKAIDSNRLFIGHRNEPNQILEKDPSLLSGNASHLSAYPGGHFEGFADAFKHAFIDFYQHLQNDEYTPSYATFEDGLYITKIIQAVFESAKQNKWIEVESL